MTAAHVSGGCLIGVCLLVVLGCKNSSVSPAVQHPGSSVDLDENIGWLHGHCLAIKNPHLGAGSELTLTLLDGVQRVAGARVLQPTSPSNACYALLEGRGEVNASAGYSFYLVDSDQGDALSLAIGVLGANEAARNMGSAVSLDINQDGVGEYFDQCSTSEGVRFFVWSREKAEENVLWQGYYYLGYDAGVTCDW